MTRADPLDDVLSLSAVVRHLEIPYAAARHLILSGQIPGIQTGSGLRVRYYVRRADVEAYQNSLTPLPDSPPPALLRADGSIRRRINSKTGQIYIAASAWTAEEEARAAAAAIRSQGDNATVTREVRPLRAYLPGAAPRGWRRSTETRYVWLVWRGLPRAAAYEAP